MAKEILFDAEGREAIRRGVNLLSKAVKLTLGPRGRNVVMQKSFGSPTITKDGATVANEIELKDPSEDIGAQMIKEVAEKTSDTAGDGTTTATIYAEAIFNEGLKNVVAGADAMSLKRGIEKAVSAVVAEFQAQKQDVTNSTQVAQVGTSAANQDAEIGAQIADAMDKVGKDGVITVEEAQSLETTVDLVEGMQFDKGYLSPHFITDAEEMIVELEDPYILVYEKKLGSLKEIVKLLEQASQGNKSILLIAEDIEGEALATLVVNKLRGTLKTCAVKAPGFGDRRKAMLEDIAVLTGATALTADLGKKLENITLDDLGQAKKVRITKDDTTIIEGAGTTEAIKGRISQVRRQIEDATSDYDKEKLEERLAKLSGGVALINVGANTESAMKEKKARVEDALHACRAAVEEGVLPGGGVAPLRARKVLDNLQLEGDEAVGVDIVRRALVAPIKIIAENSGLSGDIVCQKVSESSDFNFGYDAMAEQYGDMVKRGVIVPVLVERCALQSAAELAGLLLCCSAVIVDIPEEKDSSGGGSGPEMY
ncbi:hypothetical protein LCGC14_1470660 [marine sediment metagenome]|uniref:60 kDa chaperonin n=1 Tax=marine sediment metagenome TaxID=412755 RepID=A0A0F9JD34_9ZZZZ